MSPCSAENFAFSKSRKRSISLSPDPYSLGPTVMDWSVDLEHETVRQARLRRSAQSQPLTSIHQPHPRLPIGLTSKASSDSALYHEDISNDSSSHHRSLRLDIQGDRSRSSTRAIPGAAPPSPPSLLKLAADNGPRISQKSDANRGSGERRTRSLAAPSDSAFPSSSTVTDQAHRSGRKRPSESHLQGTDKPPLSVPQGMQVIGRGGTLGPPILIPSRETTRTPRNRLLLAPPPHTLPPATAYTRYRPSGTSIPLPPSMDLADQVILLKEEVAGLSQTLSVERVENTRAHLNILSYVADIANRLPDTQARDTATVQEGLRQQKAELRCKYNELTAFAMSAHLAGMANSAEGYRDELDEPQSNTGPFQPESIYVPPRALEHSAYPQSTRPLPSSQYPSYLPTAGPGDNHRMEENPPALLFPSQQDMSHPPPLSSMTNPAILDQTLFTRKPLGGLITRSVLDPLEAVYEGNCSPIARLEGTTPVDERMYTRSRPRWINSTARRHDINQGEEKSEWDAKAIEYMEGDKTEAVGLKRGNLKRLLN